MLEESQAHQWERGCQTDDTRNAFIIPTLVRLLSAFTPATILDIGAGTGYVARNVDEKLLYRPTWTLIDHDSERMALARSLCPSQMIADMLTADAVTHRFPNRHDAAIATFTLLEISEIDKFLASVVNSLNEAGLFIIAIPDTLDDVIKYSKINEQVLPEYLLGETSIPKIDKFTKETYPFRVVRVERLISKVLENGFNLVDLIENHFASTGCYTLLFQKRPLP